MLPDGSLLSGVAGPKVFLFVCSLGLFVRFWAGLFFRGRCGVLKKYALSLVLFVLRLERGIPSGVVFLRVVVFVGAFFGFGMARWVFSRYVSFP